MDFGNFRHFINLIATFAIFLQVSCGSVESSIDYALSGAEVSLQVVSNISTQSLQKGGTSIQIEWTIKDPEVAKNSLIIESSTDDGVTWINEKTVSLNLLGSDFTLPNISTSTYKYRVYYYNTKNEKTYLYTSNSITIDSNKPQLTLKTLNDGGHFAGGSITPITWLAEDQSLASNAVAIYYSTNQSTWNLIANNQSLNSSYNWTVPSIDANQVWIKITATDEVGFSNELVSELPFTIDSTSPNLTITSPVLSEVWNPLSSNTINLSASDSNLNNNSLNIDISTDGGVTYTRLFSNQVVSNSFTLTSAAMTSISDSTMAMARVSVSDEAGNTTSTTSPLFTLSRTFPQLTTNQDSTVFSNQNTYTFTGVCDLSASMSVTDITVTGPMISTTVSCTGTGPSPGTWTYTTPSFTTDASRSFQFSQTNNSSSTTTKTVNWIRDTVSPNINSVSINNGAALTITPFAKVNVTAYDDQGFPLKIFISEPTNSTDVCAIGDAIEYSQNQSSATHEFNLSMTDGEKKLCVWSKDYAGNQSSMTLSTGDIGTNAAKINFEAGSLPVVSNFEVINPKNSTRYFTAGEPVQISWQISDAEELATSPITLEYSTDGVEWKNIVKNYGSLASGTKNYNSNYSSFVAPTSGFFMVRLTAVDAAGNKSLRISSNLLNAGQWTVFAGNSDMGIGGSAKSISLPVKTATAQSIAIHPKTGEIFIQSGYGIVSVNTLNSTTKLIVTGENLDSWSETGLSDNGGTITNPKLSYYLASINFDSEGRLYVNANYKDGSDQSSRIYQIDLTKNTSRLYAGGGTNSSPTSPTDAIVEFGPIGFDEANSMYIAVPCSTTLPERLRKLYKITQQNDGTAGTMSLVAGNCADVAATSGTLATSTSFARGLYYNYGAIWVKDLGNTIYFTSYGIGPKKIINGTFYNTNIPGSGQQGIAYSSKENALYVVHNNSTYGYIHRWKTLGLAQSGGETSDGIIIPYGASSSTCWDDNIAASASCPEVQLSLAINKYNTLMWLDGLKINTPGAIRLRYLDKSQKLQTLAGTKPFTGDGLHKSVMRSSEGITSIHYKSTTEGGSIFTPGLYFGDSVSMLFGRINPNDTTEVLWGNQINGGTGLIANGTAISKNIDMGYRYTINGGTFSFDSDNLPWFRIANRLLKVNADGTITNKQTGSYNTNWTAGTEGAVTASSLALYPHGLYQNFYIKGNHTVFLMGYYYSVADMDINTNNSVIRALNFNTDSVSKIIGGIAGGANGAADATNTDLTNQNLSSICVSQYCSLQFVENDASTVADDELYYSEGKKIRRITNPLTPGSQKLETLYTVPDILFPSVDDYNRVTNFYVTPDRSRIFYIVSDRLYCHKISTGTSSWCNNTNLGYPESMGEIPRRSNQFTMKDSSTLLINNSKVILQFTLPSD